MRFVKYLAVPAIAALASPAYAAVSVADLQSGANVVIWHSGASASTFSVQEAVISNLCDNSDSSGKPVNLYGNNADNTKADMWTVECTSVAFGGVAAGTKVIYSKRDKGGSGVGVNTLLSGQDVAFMVPISGSSGQNCPATSGGDVTVGTNTAVHYFNCSANYNSGAGSVSHVLASLVATDDSVLVKPTYGTSDIEADKFTYALNTPNVDLNLDGTNDTITATVNTLVKAGLGYLVFGLPVNVLMYQDLQRAQFPSGHPLFNDCNPSGASYGSIGSTTANANKAKCLPSLTSAELRSVFMAGGAIRNIGDFQRETAYQSGAFTSITGTGTTSNVIHICRRGNGSGTQASFNANVLGYPCDDLGNWLTPALGTDGGLVNFAHAGSDATAVENCLNDFNNAANASGFNTGTAVKAWAIGIQSSEKNANLANDYRFIAIDGVAPTLANVHAGDYYHFAQQNINYVTGSLSGSRLDVYNTMVTAFANPTKLGNLGVDQPFGRSGWLAAPAASGTNAVTATLSNTAPVTTFVKLSGGGLANTCAPPRVFKATGVRATAAPQNCTLDNGSSDQTCY